MTTSTAGDALLDRVDTNLGSLAPAGSGILLAVSGGSDSLGMMHLLARLAPAHDHHLVVGFVDHGLREGVDSELAVVRREAGKLDLPVFAVDLAAEGVRRDTSMSLQAWAREARYSALNAVAKKRELAFVATGHTADDQAETVLMRLARGTGLDGLAGIRRRWQIANDVTIIRPILDLRREELRAFLGSERVGWVDEPSNRDLNFQRVRIREEVVPVLESLHPGAAAKIASLAEDAALRIEFSGSKERGEAEPLERLRLGGGIRVTASRFERHPQPLWGALVRRALQEASGTLRRLERKHIDAIVELIGEKTISDRLPLPGAINAFVSRGSLYVFPAELPAGVTESSPPRRTDSGGWRLECAPLGCDAVVQLREGSERDATELRIRARKPGDVLSGSRTKLKELLIEASVPRFYRNFVPLLARGGEIVSVPRLLPSRDTDIEIDWTLKSDAPFLDIDFGSQRN